MIVSNLQGVQQYLLALIKCLIHVYHDYYILFAENVYFLSTCQLGCGGDRRNTLSARKYRQYLGLKPNVTDKHLKIGRYNQASKEKDRSIWNQMNSEFDLNY